MGGGKGVYTVRVCELDVALLGEPLRLTDLGGIGGGLLVVGGEFWYRYHIGHVE